MGFFKTAASKVFDFRVDRWLGYENIKNNANYLRSYVTSRFKTQQPERLETWDEAVERLRLDEVAIKSKKREFILMCLIYILISCGIFSYAVYMGVNGFYSSALISLSLTTYTLALAFKYHFWLFQIKNKKLGCTLNEWANSKIKVEK